MVLFRTFRLDPWYRASLCSLASLLAAPGDVTPFRSTLSSPAVTDVATAEVGTAEAGTGVVFGTPPGIGADAGVGVVAVPVEVGRPGRGGGPATPVWA